MLAQFTPASSTMKLALNQTFAFLHPSPAPEHVPSTDPVITGVITLTLAKRKSIKSISVRLAKFCNLLHSDNESVSLLVRNSAPLNRSSCRYESGETTEAEVSLTSPNDEVLLEKGEHNYAFTIIIPSSLAPSEKSKHGRIFYKIVGTAKGVGFMGSYIKAEQRIIIIASPTA